MEMENETKRRRTERDGEEEEETASALATRSAEQEDVGNEDSTDDNLKDDEAASARLQLEQEGQKEAAQDAPLNGICRDGKTADASVVERSKELSDEDLDPILRMRRLEALTHLERYRFRVHGTLSLVYV